MKNGIEYSKSKKFRIIERDNMYYIEQETGSVWVPCPNGPWDYLNNARYDMQKWENLLCPQ